MTQVGLSTGWYTGESTGGVMFSISGGPNFLQDGAGVLITPTALDCSPLPFLPSMHVLFLTP